MKVEIVHTPVLLRECLRYLSPAGEPFGEDALMVDSTLGEGGHSFHFLSAHPALRVIGVDADADIQARARERLSAFGGRVSFWSGWFSDFFRDYSSETKPNIILFDLGISVFHYERSGRGFSFRRDEPLDMRLRAGFGRSAADIVNTTREEELSGLIYRNSDERLSRKIARAICAAREHSRIMSSKALADIIYDAVPESARHGPIHPATRTFQALRIAVNGELSRLPRALHDAFNTLSPGGKMGVITFHSLEDRIVKGYFRNLGRKCVCPPGRVSCACGGEACAHVLTRKPVEPDGEEVRRNPPSRSAKLRVVRKLRDAKELRLAGISAEER